MPAVEGGTVCIIGAGGSMGASIIGALAVRAVVAWEELGGAFLAGLRAPRLERPNERFFICAQTPLSKIDVEKTGRLLGWKAEHAFEQAYRIGDRPERRS